MENIPPSIQNERAHHKATNTSRPMFFGSRLLRASAVRGYKNTTQRSRNFPHRTTSSLLTTQHVRMKDENGIICARGIVDLTIQKGMDVDGLTLFSHQSAVQIIQVYESGHFHTDEIGRMMKDCIGQWVRWPKKHLEHIVDDLQSNTRADAGHQQFDFVDGMDDDIINNEDQFHRSDSTESAMAGASRSQTALLTISTLPVKDGLPKPPAKRTYNMTNRTSKPVLDRVIGESRDSKCTFSSVKAARASSKCSKACLANITEKKILNLRFDAWSSDKYEDRASWIVKHLGEFYTEDDRDKGKDRFDFKLDGHPICHGCYSLALGYSKSRVEELKWSIRSTSEHLRRTSAIHGNASKPPRASIQADATRIAFERYIRESGCIQPDRECCLKKDKVMVPLVLLPMNTQRKDVMEAVNDEVKQICEGKVLGKNEFYKMWRHEYTYVQIPPHSRFSKCQTCWEYRTCLEASKSPIQKEAVKTVFLLHGTLHREERRDYWRAKENAILFPTESLCLIVDGMDQNTTMVPKFRQSVKGIEGRYVKTHLCGILVHGVGLYTDVWIDSHHKHDSNQVVTSIIHVLGDVRSRRGNTFPPVLRIQADNCGRENKNQYMFGLCAALVGLKYFAEVHISFLIVGHTHEDIDQRFSVISGTLKSRDIDSLKELLELVKKGASHTEAFATSRQLEHVWDWKSFITPHLRVGLDAIIGVSVPHHFKFYLKDGMPYVQKKNYARDSTWEPECGYQYLRSLPVEGEQPDLAIIKEADDRELKALESFIQMKERCIARKQYVEKNLDAIEEAQRLMDYLIEFPGSDKSEAKTRPFWPDGNGFCTVESEVDRRAEEQMADGVNGSCNTVTEDIRDVLSNLPPIECRGYFGPMRDRPRNKPTRSNKKQRPTSIDHHPINPLSSRAPFPTFDALEDVKKGHFVAMCTSVEDRETGIPFFLGKVIQMRGNSKSTRSMLVTWYWPKSTRLQDDLGMWHRRYQNCMQRKWEPSSEPTDWIDVDTTITSWMNKSKSKNETINVGGVETEREISIPKAQVYHLIEHMANLTEDIDEERFDNDLHDVQQYNSE